MDRDRNGHGRGTGFENGFGRGSGSGGGGVGREQFVGRYAHGDTGHILVLGLRVSGTKYASLSYAAERSNFEMRSSGKGREKNWGTKHSVQLTSGSVDFSLPQALDFKFTHEKYNVIIIDVMRYKRHPRRLIRNEPRHVGSIHLNVRQLMDAPDDPQWFPLLGGNGYIRIQYSPSFDSAIKIREWAALTAAQRHSSIDSMKCEYDFLGFEVPIGFEDVYQSEFSFFKMTDVNGLMWSAAGGLAEFMKLDNADIRSSPMFEPIFWRGIPRAKRETIYRCLCRVQFKKNRLGQRYYHRLANKALNDRASLTARAVTAPMRGLDAASSGNPASLWPAAAAIESPEPDVDDEFSELEAVPTPTHGIDERTRESIHSIRARQFSFISPQQNPDLCQHISANSMQLPKTGTATLEDVATLVQKGKSFVDGPMIAQIELDLNRTFSGARTSLSAPGEGQDQLRRVLLAFSCHNRATGYCQSLNFVAGFLLLVLPSEEAAFFALVRIVEELCPGYYAVSLQGLLVDFLILEDLISTINPDLRAHMNRIGVDANMIVAAPMMSLFVGHLPTITTLRFLDVFLLYGRRVLLAGLMVILNRCSRRLTEECFNVVEFHSAVQEEMAAAWNAFTFMEELKDMNERIRIEFIASGRRHAADVEQNVMEEARISFRQQFDFAADGEHCTSSHVETDYSRRFDEIFNLFHSFCYAPVIDHFRVDAQGFATLIEKLFPDESTRPQAISSTRGVEPGAFTYFSALDFNDDGSISFAEFLCAVVFLEPHDRVPARKKLRVAFGVFNQFKVNTVHKHQVILLLAWLGRVTYVLRHQRGVASFYRECLPPVPSVPPEEGGARPLLGRPRLTRLSATHGPAVVHMTGAEKQLLLEVLQGHQVGFTFAAVVELVSRVPVFAAAYALTESADSRTGVHGDACVGGGGASEISTPMNKMKVVATAKMLFSNFLDETDSDTSLNRSPLLGRRDGEGGDGKRLSDQVIRAARLSRERLRRGADSDSSSV